MPEFDAIVVGAGPAGTTAALAMAQKGLRILLLERGESPGAKNMFGGMLAYTPIPERLLPGFWARAPWERHVVKRVLTVVGEGSSTSLAYHSTASGGSAADGPPDGPPYAGFTLFRPQFDRWYADQAREAGVTLVCDCLVEGLVVKHGRVCGVRVARSEGVVEAPLVVACDGALSFLAQEAGLYAGPKPEQVALGVRALYRLGEQEVNERFGLSGREGATHEFLGCTDGIRGGGFVYTQIETLAVGMVLHLDSLREKGIAPYDLLDRFVGSEPVAPFVKGARLVEYSAHLLPEGGLGMVPRLSTAGLLVAGDAAALCYTNGLTQEGMNLAMASGYIAAAVGAEAIGAGDVSADMLALYEEMLRESPVIKDMTTFARAVDLLHRDRLYSEYPKAVAGIMDGLYRSDGAPKRKIGGLSRDAVKGTVSVRQLIGDAFEVGRSFLW